jgi:uncharacterized membrane protein YhaH (DUF805 family)
MDVNAIIENFRNVVTNHYVDFQGRARRTVFWYYVLAYFVIYVVLAIIDSILGISGVLAGLFSLALLLPGLGLYFRRIHDINRSAWWLLIGFIPIVGIIVLIYWFAQPGTVGPNEYGADPKH